MAFIRHARYVAILDALRLLALLVLCVATGCTGGQVADEMEVLGFVVRNNIPSGSGVVVNPNDSLVFVGDDATKLFIADIANLQVNEIAIKSIPARGYREPKSTKHDFESASRINIAGQPVMFAFGSGSQSPSRDTVLYVNARNYGDQSSFSLSAFYDSLRRQTNTPSSAWNIEGSTMTRNKLFLANRGNNMLMRFAADSFMAYVLAGMPMPKAEDWHEVKLPLLQGKQARLSGLATINDSLLLFCASVEDTKDWVSDGPVLGSLIGVYSLTARSVRKYYLLKSRDGTVLKEKIESVDRLPGRPGKPAELVAIADNDNGSTKIFRIRLPIELP